MYLRKSHWPKRIVFEKEECIVSFFLNTSGSSEKSSKTKTKGGVLEFKFSVGIIQKQINVFYCGHMVLRVIIWVILHNHQRHNCGLDVS